MGNLVGEKFEGYVFNQIDARQTAYGSGYLDGAQKTINQQLLINNKNSWIKMASSVSVQGDSTPQIFNSDNVLNPISKGEKRLRDIGITDTYNFLGDQLAKKTVLFNTLSEVSPTGYDKEGLETSPGSYNFRAGVSKLNTLWNSGNSYGLGGTDKGISPAPGIKSLNVDSLNRGSIRKATIEIKCYNKFQFELLELVYIRLGYTMMLEWGFDKYTTNGENIKETGNTIIEDVWFNTKGSIDQLGMLNIIEEYRERYSGCYDGFYGKVSNFSWKFNTDGTYDISLDLMTVGDVIESLLIATKTTSLNLIQLNAITGSSNFPTGLNDSPIVTNAGDTSISQDMFTDILSQDWGKKGGDYISPSKVMNSHKQTEATNADSLTKYDYYMSFGALIDKIDRFCVPRMELDGGDKQYSMIQFDDDISSNVCSIFPNQMSLDPRVCLIQPVFDVNTKIDSKNNQATQVFADPGWEYFKEFRDAKQAKGANVIFGKIMNVYLNYDFISKLLSKNSNQKNSKNQLTIYKFLTQVCEGINLSLGGINNLEVVIKDDNKITILEQNPIPGIELLYPDKLISPPSFEMYGISEEGQSNFVKDFSFDTQITPELATSISIGATANNIASKNYDATAFSKWNEGLFDRFAKKFIDPIDEAFKLKQRALVEQANELGIEPNNYINVEEAVELYNAFNERGVESATFDAIEDGALMIRYKATQKLYVVSRVSDYLIEGTYDIFQGGINYFRSNENQVDTSGDDVGNIADADLFKENFAASLSKNYETSALGVSLKGKKSVPKNIAYGLDSSRLSWEEYIFEVTNFKKDELLKEIIPLDSKDLAAKYSSNYIFYMTRIFGGKFIPPNVATEVNAGMTDADEASYWNYLPQVIKSGKNAFSAYTDTINNIHFEKLGTPSNTIGFIPVNLGFTCEGISGIKIYNQIVVRQGFLPKQYPDSLKFLISKVAHRVEDNTWLTSLETISTPKTKLVPNTITFQNLSSAASDVEQGRNIKPEYFGPAPNAKRVREYLATVTQFSESKQGKDGNNGSTTGINPKTEELRGELSSGGDIKSTAADQVIAVFKAIRAQSKTIFLRITAGNDLYHQNIDKTYTSRHESGFAVDFVVVGANKADLKLVKNVLNSFIVGSKNWYYLDEYANQTKKATGNHFHMSSPTAERKFKGTEDSEETLEAKRLLAENKIKKLP